MPEFTLIFTTEAFRSKGRSYPRVPLLLKRGDKVVEVVCDWLRHLAIEGGYRVLTLRSYAEALRLFWNQLGPVRWDRVDDDFLLAWRTAQENQGVHRKTINGRIDVVFRFYLWAQDVGLLRHHIGVPAWDEGGRSDIIYPLTAKIRVATSKDGVVRTSRVSSLRFPNVGSKRDLHTPTDAETSRVHAELGRGKKLGIGERNTLMASWAEEAGLRRKEFVGLVLLQIPGWDAIYELIQSDGLFELQLTITKGDKPRRIRVAPELLLRTREYIDTTRAEVVERVRKRKANYREPESVFISDKTGESLNPGSVSNLLGEAFREAEVPGWGHRLRARYLTNLTEGYFMVEYAKHGKALDPHTVLLLVAEAAGHARLESLRPYLNLVRKRHAIMSDAQGAVDRHARSLSKLRLVEQRLRALQSEANVRRELEGSIGGEAADKAIEVFTQFITRVLSEPRPDLAS